MNQIKKISSSKMVVVVFAFAMALGYAIYQRSALMSQTEDGNAPPTRGAPFFLVPTPLSSPIQMRKLSPEEIQALVFPGQDATAQERAAYDAIVAKIAAEAPFLDINDCAPQPVVMKWSMKGDTLKLRNSDMKPHMIRIGNTKITIGPNAVKEIRSSEFFTRGSGNYGYACDGFLGFAGMFFVVP